MKKRPPLFGISGPEDPIVNWIKTQIDEKQVPNFWQALIFRCLRINPNDRPDINTIRIDIVKHLNLKPL